MTADQSPRRASAPAHQRVLRAERALLAQYVRELSAGGGAATRAGRVDVAAVPSDRGG